MSSTNRGQSLNISGNSNTIGNIFTTAGNIGIGTTSPSVKLDLGSTANNQILALYNSNIANSYYGFGAMSNTLNYMSGFNHKFYVNSGWGTMGTAVMTLLTSGNVGIGTASPAYTLDVSGVNPIRFTNTTAGPMMLMQTSNTSSSIFSEWNKNSGTVRGIIGLDGAGYSGATNDFLISTWTNHAISFATNQINRMCINTAGNVGINTTSPGAPLTVNGDIRATPSASGNNVGFNLVRSGIADWYIYNPTGSSNLRFYNSGDLMTITSSGNVGIGTASPSQTLDVNGNVKTTHCHFMVSGGTGTFTNTTLIYATTTLRNSGSCYNTSTGYFTAPVTGVYSFSATGNASVGAGLIIAQGTSYYGVQYNTGSIKSHITVSSIVYLTANQTIRVISDSGSGITLDSWDAFMGTLLYAV